MRSDPLRKTRLEHEGHGTGQLHRLQLAVASVVERLAVRTVRQHAVVQADAARREALRLGVVDAVQQPHELRHDVHVIPGRPKGVLRHRPALRKDHEVDVSGARGLRRRGQHREDRGIGMIEADRADRRERAQVVFVRRVIAMPGHHVDRRMRQLGQPQFATPLHEQLGRRVLVFIGGHRRQEIAGIGQAIRADRPSLRQGKRTAVVFAEIAACRPRRNLGPEFDAARNHHDFAGLRIDHPEFGDQAQVALLQHEHHLTVGVVEVLVHHRLGDEIDMCRHARLGVGIAGRGHGLHALQERHLAARHRRRIPAVLSDRQFALEARRGPPQPGIDFGEATGMPHRGANAIEPGALICAARRGEGRAGQLLGVKPVGATLRRVAPDRQRTGQRLGFETVAEPGHIARRHIGGGFADDARSCVVIHGHPP